MWQVPLWLIVFFATTYIIFFYMNCQRNDGVRKRNFLSLLPVSYFWIIYLSFWLFDVGVEIRAIWGRYGILAILIVDTWHEFVELWEMSLKYKFCKWKEKSKKENGKIKNGKNGV